MTRWWTDLVAAVSDAIPLPLLLLSLLVAAGVAGLLWYFFPAWVPRRLPRLRRPRWRRPRAPHLRWPAWVRPGELLSRLLAWLRSLRWPWRRRPGDELATEPTTEPATEPATEPDGPQPDLVPDLPADALAALADRLAAQGRYAEAIRERLRAMVRLLVERGVIADRPGWTVTELAAAARVALPPVATALTGATALFSDIWYAQRPATAEADARMRAFGEQITAATVDRRPAWA